MYKTPFVTYKNKSIMFFLTVYLCVCKYSDFKNWFKPAFKLLSIALNKVRCHNSIDLKHDLKRNEAINVSFFILVFKVTFFKYFEI